MIEITSPRPNSPGNLLPLDFVPSQYSVIIGRAKECKEASGNKLLRILATSYLSKYSNAINRCVKSQVVSDIVALVRVACPEGAFIKKIGKEDGGTGWIEVSESGAREKVGYVFRDLLSDQYRSSSKSKSLNRQKRQRKQAQQGIPSPDQWNLAVTPIPDPTSSSLTGILSLVLPSTQSTFEAIPTALLSMTKKRSDSVSSSEIDTLLCSSIMKVFEPTPVFHIPAMRRGSDFAWMDTLASKLQDE
jgi:hypothetical protein